MYNRSYKVDVLIASLVFDVVCVDVCQLEVEKQTIKLFCFIRFLPFVITVLLFLILRSWWHGLWGGWSPRVWWLCRSKYSKIGNKVLQKSKPVGFYRLHCKPVNLPLANIHKCHLMWHNAGFKCTDMSLRSNNSCRSREVSENTITQWAAPPCLCWTFRLVLSEIVLKHPFSCLSQLDFSVFWDFTNG